MANILFYDRRIDARPPVGFEKVITTDQHTDLVREIEELVNWLRGSGQPMTGWHHSVDILCHGLDTGLQLGSIPITQNNVYLFAPLRGIIGLIMIHSCRAACTYLNTGYNGAEMCSRLARVVSARVMASDALQPYLPDNSITNRENTTQLPGWRGNVGTWLPNGRLFSYTNYH